MDQALTAIHQVLGRKSDLTFRFAYIDRETAVVFEASDRINSRIAGPLYSQFPECRIEARPVEPSANEPSWAADLDLHRWIFPIRRYAQFEDALNRVTADPLTPILSAIRPRDPALQPRIEIVVRPASHRGRHRAERILRKLASPVFRRNHRLNEVYLRASLSRNGLSRVFARILGLLARGHHEPVRELTTTSSRQHDREDDLQAASDKLGKLLFEVSICLTVSGPPKLEAEAIRTLQGMAAAFGQFSVPRLASFHMGRIGRRPNRKPPRFLLNTEELATIWHPPTQTVKAPTMASVVFRELEPPVTLPTPKAHPHIAVLGRTVFRSLRRSFGILPDDRRRHLALLGKTGMGKSTLLHHLLCSDIRAGQGCALIDPHGDLCELVLASIPRERTNDVILFDAGDRDFPIAFNPLTCPHPDLRPLVASGVLSAFKKLYGHSWGPRLEHIFRNCLLALLEIPGSSLVSVLRLLSDTRYRQSVVQRLTDPAVRVFFEREFASMPPKLQAEAIAPVLNKVGQFVSSPLLRNILGQPHTRLDLRSIMDDGKILLINLSKGRIGDDASSLLGSLLVTNLQLAAMSRADLPEHKRRDFLLYVDEFQNFATDSFATILSEARKYRLLLTIANQYLAQIDEATLAAVFGNVGTLIAFQVGAQDSEIVAQQLGADVDPKDLMQIPKHHAYARLLIEGQPSRPFTMQTIPPSARPQNWQKPAILRRATAHRYGRPKAEVEKLLAESFHA